MKTYWITWSVLLAFTLVMLVMDAAPIPRLAFVVFMVVAMLTKASIIGANFMHLRHERLPLVLTVIFGLLVTAIVLFVLIAPDAARIHDMATTNGRP